MSSNNKMKGLLKGLRYISEIFENEKEPEMQIGMPTDVKHVAHIGVDGPAAAQNSAPSWMNEFKSAPLEEDPVKWSSQDTVSREGPRAQSSSITDMQQEVPKSSKRGSTSSSKEKSDKSKQSKKGSKSSSSKETSESTTKHKKKSNQATDSKSEDTKKSSRQKKSKESVDGSSRRSRNRDFDNGSESGSLTSKASGFEEGEY